jgi:hypothetical protein
MISMSKKHLFPVLSLLIGLALQTPLHGQYMADTTLSYTEFLTECQDFARKTRPEVWVVNFWASHNGASLSTLYDIKDIHQDYQDKPVRFVFISVDKRKMNWESRLDQYELPGEQLFLPSEADYSFLKNAFAHNSLPGIFLVNQDAQVQRVRDTRELRTLLAISTTDLPDTPYYKPATTPDPIDNKPPVDESKPDGLPDGTTIVDGWITHEVKAGETLFSLYRKYGVKVADIKRINGLSSNTIKIGQKIKIKKP